MKLNEPSSWLPISKCIPTMWACMSNASNAFKYVTRKSYKNHSSMRLRQGNSPLVGDNAANTSSPLNCSFSRTIWCLHKWLGISAVNTIRLCFSERGHFIPHLSWKTILARVIVFSLPHAASAGYAKLGSLARHAGLATATSVTGPAASLPSILRF